MRTVAIAGVRLVTPGLVDASLLRHELPSVRVEALDAAGAAGDCDATVDAREWILAREFRTFDGAIEDARSDTIAIRGAAAEDVVRVACEVLTRYQRHIARRNAASGGLVFDAVLRAHACLHDVGKPLVRADYDHALDTWQWMLRLDADASLAAQCAALLHDVERLESEADRRIEHRAPDYQAFKDAHARRGAARAFSVLLEAGVESHIAARAHGLIASHERRGVDAEVDLLNDADALSFFSLNSAGYADYFGREQTRRKIRYTLARMSPRARGKLRLARLRSDIAQLLGEAEAA